MKQRVKRESKAGEAIRSRWCWFVLPGRGNQIVHYLCPIVQRRRFKVTAVRPDQRVNFRIDSDLIEQSRIMERAEQFSRQHRLEVDHLFAAVIESNSQRLGRNDLKRLDAVNSVHVLSPYLSGSIG